MKKLGILTSGGDAPGMNAAIRAAVRTATSCGVEMVGYRDGFRGLVARDFVPLDDRSVGNVIQHGGTFLGTSRCPSFHQPEVRAEAAKKMREDGVEGLVVIGGDGSFRGALALEAEAGIAVSGVPGTIDNDVYGTDETIGFDSAVNTALLAIDQLRDTSESTGMMFFVEVMGRTSGAIAIAVAVAGGATGVLVPETSDDIPLLIHRIRQQMARGKRSHIIVVSEGDEAGGALPVAKEVAARMNHPYRVVVLGHTQRGGRPTARDRIVASVSGAAAVEALLAGRSGRMIGIQGGKMVEVPLTEVVEKKHPPFAADMLNLAQQIAG